MALLFTLTFTANAMSYEQAREQALFLTDKMAYELNLTDDQYEAAYEINLDYLMSVNTVDDLYGSYWRYRNLDMSYVLLDWQYLPPALLQRWLLALWSIRTLSASRLLLLRSSSRIHKLLRRTLLAQKPRTLMV